MGTGANVQERLIALHRLDAPWRSADVEQREGRILRQGNANAEVRIYRYVTEQSFDGYSWQVLENKARFIAGELLLYRAERMRGTRAGRLVGSIAGFQVLLADNLLQGPEIILKGATTYLAKVTDTAHATIRSAEHTLQHLDDVADQLARTIADMRRRRADT
jgi:hypothetical protein